MECHGIIRAAADPSCQSDNAKTIWGSIFIFYVNLENEHFQSNFLVKLLPICMKQKLLPSSYSVLVSKRQKPHWKWSVSFENCTVTFPHNILIVNN